MDSLLVASAIFASSMGLCLSVLLRYGRSGNGPGSRRTFEDEDTAPTAPFGRWTSTLAGQFPASESTRAKLAAELRGAGFHGSEALETYLAARALMVWGAALATLGVAAIAAPSDLPVVLGIGLVAMGLGFSLPRAFVGAKAKARGQQLERSLPIALDLLALGLEAGQGLQRALERVGLELATPYPALGEELAITVRVAEVRSLRHALNGLAERIPRGEFRNLAQVLIQADRLGTDLSGALLEFAADLRSRLRQRAETQANRLSLWMLFPTIFCLLTASAIILIGPVVVEFREKGGIGGGAANARAPGSIASPNPR